MIHSAFVLVNLASGSVISPAPRGGSALAAFCPSSLASAVCLAIAARPNPWELERDRQLYHFSHTTLRIRRYCRISQRVQPPRSPRI
jgi:hypothetical protein